MMVWAPRKNELRSKGEKDMGNQNNVRKKRRRSKETWDNVIANILKQISKTWTEANTIRIEKEEIFIRI